MRQQNRIAFFNILSVILINGISVITAPLFFRLLGDSGYGISKIYNIWSSVVAIVFTFQTYNTLVNARVEYSQEQQLKYQSSVMSLSLGIFLVCSLLVGIFIRPISQALKLEPMLIGFLLLQSFGTFCVNFLSTKFVYEYKANWNMALSLTVSITTLVLSLALILPLPQHLRYYGRVAAVSLTYGILGIAACIYILAKGKCFLRKDYWKFCALLALPAVFHNLSDLILGQSDQVMIQHMLGEDQVGWYGMAWNLGNILFVLFGALNRTWCPYFFDEMKQGKREAVLEKTRNFLELSTVLACGFVLLCPEVFRIYAGSQYPIATLTIPLFASSYYFNFLCTFPVNYEYYHKKTKVVAAVTISASLVNIGLNYLLIQRMGIAGAALATALSHLLQLALHHSYCRLHLGRGDYPFPVPVWAGYGLCYLAVLLAGYAAWNFWLPRWALGAAIGVFELLRLRKRKVLI